MSLKQTVHDKILTDILKAQIQPKQWKVLVLDDFSKHMLSTCYKMHEIISWGITLLEDINKSREPLPKLEAVYLITPSEKSVKALISDYESAPNIKYKAAHVYFLEACPDDLFNLLCKSTCAKFIKTLQEINASFIPYESQVYSLGSPEAFPSFYNSQHFPGSGQDLEKCAEQLATLCATLREYPAIRYSSSFEGNADFAKLVQKKLDAYKADDPTMGGGPMKDRSMLLILDRGFDPVTPLLHEMTFQAMAYDLLPIENDNVYRYTNENDDNVEEKECVLDEYDDLWSELRHEHIAVVSRDVVKKMKQFAESKHMKLSEKTSVRDLNQMLKQAPEYQKELSMFSAHFHLAEDCMRQYQRYVNKLCLVEQGLAMGTDSEGERIRDQLKMINPILLNESLNSWEKIRVIMLYIVHQAGISEENLDKLIQHAQIEPEKKCIITNAQKLGIPIIREDEKRKSQQLYQCVNRKERQHEDTYETSRWTPYLRDILEDALEDKLDPKQFPFQSAGMAGKPQGTSARSARQGGQDKNRQSLKSGPRLIVFVLGGVTFSEIRCAYNITHEVLHWEVLVGGTHRLTPQTFLDDLRQLSPVTEPSMPTVCTNTVNSL